jgi:signal transduction histidine kinase
MSDALPRIGWLGGAIAIVLMWDRLLELKKNHPRIHQLFVGTIFLNIGLIPCALLPGLVNAAVLVVVELANYLNILNFFVSMTLIFISWRRSRRIELAIYFVAFIIPAAGTLINTTMNQGLLPSNVVVVNFYQLASLVHVVVMSFGLGLRLRQLQRDKVAAQQEVAVALRRSEEQRRFVAMLSHEFRNPLAAIDRTAQMIQIKTQDLPQAEAQRLAQIRANVAILSGFVDNFLMTEALDHGALVLTRKPCGIRELIETAARAQGEPSGKRILLGACPDDAAFPLDPTLIGAAVGNLLANALLYSPAGSQVEISASLDAPEGKGLRIRVADHGPGISEAELAKLGTPYFRAATSLGKKGSGLGYHFTRRIVQAHGGTLTARSPGGGGLQVEIFLP